MKCMYYIVLVGMGILFVNSLYILQSKSNQVIESIQISSHEKKNQFLISPERAQIIACNDIRETQTGVELSHPSHFVKFESQGILFQPKQGPQWKWKLEHIGTKDEPLRNICVQSVKPEQNGSSIIEYRYGDIVEEYHTKLNSIEQRFVLEKPVIPEGQDLVIQGGIECDAEFEQSKEGWIWKDNQGQIALGDVTVFDAQGKILLAHMNVTAHQTEIVVDAKSLAQAAYPVTVDPEIGANDFRISDMGADGDENFGAFIPKVAYNSTDNEYLVVWSGDDHVSSLVDGESEIFGQRINATTGLEVGANDFRISDMGPDGSTHFSADSLAVAYNSTDNEYLVVWSGDDDIFPLVQDESEIFGQRIDAATGLEVGANDFRISDMGPDGDISFAAFSPDVVYNPTDNEYLVVWSGDDNVFPLFNDEIEVFGQRIDASTGQEVGLNDFRISDMGDDGNLDFDAFDPAVTYNTIANEYLVVWSGDDNSTPFIVNDEFEIYGQRIDAATGLELGVNDFRISDMGPDGNFFFGAQRPAVAYNSVNNEYLVVWDGSNDLLNLALTEREIYGQRINESGVQIGVNDFRISDMGPDGSISFGALTPQVAYSPNEQEYFIVWSGNDDISSSIFELEIYGQRLNNFGNELGANDFRISDVGPNEDMDFTAFSPAVVYNFIDSEYLTVWQADDDSAALVDNEFEIFGQRLQFILSSDIDKLSLSSGGIQTLTLNFGPNFAGQNYLVLGSLVGTSPGTFFGGKIVPLNIGAYFLSTLNNPNDPNSTLPNGFGVLDEKGRATVQFVLPPGVTLPLGVKHEVNHAAVVIDVQQTTIKITAVSNPAPCKLE